MEDDRKPAKQNGGVSTATAAPPEKSSPPAAEAPPAAKAAGDGSTSSPCAAAYKPGGKPAQGQQQAQSGRFQCRNRTGAHRSV